jgi:diguanylate cyclase (GGDEF)-like protein/PAS domain S-box-containing protein
MPIATSTHTVRILILHDSQDNAEKLISELRNFGYATRAHLIKDEVDLLDALSHGAWDFMFARPKTDDLSAYSAIKHIHAKDKDIPTIILCDENNSQEITEGLKNGARDVVPVGELERLKLVFQRELASSNDRKMRRQAEIRLREAEKRCTLLLNNSRDAITYIHDGMHIYANDTYINLFGYEDASELEGTTIMDMIAAQDKDKFKQFLRTHPHSNGENEFNCYTLRNDGSEIKTHMLFSEALYDGESCIQIILRVDRGTSEFEENIRKISSQDLLTGLNNRQFFIDQLDQAIAENTEKQKNASLLYLNLDGFDALKVPAGLGSTDLILTDLAMQLKELLPDNNTLSRFANDVFTLLIPGDETAATQAARSIVKTVADHIYQVGNQSYQLTISIGIALITENVANSNDLITRACNAMLDLQKKQGNGFNIFTPQKISAPPETSKSVSQLEEALAKDLFVLMFQPIINLRGEHSELYEVLIRIRNKEGKLTGAADILNDAEKFGLSIKVDRWVVLQAIKKLSAQHEKGKKTRLFISLTPASIQDKTFLPWLSVAFKASRLPPHSIIWQMTETDMGSTLKEAKQFAKSVEEIHCQLAVNRFGCALNPFNLLKHLNVTYLKIDPSFIEDLSSESNKDALKEIIAAAHAQGKLTIIPFVENAAILSTLWQIGTNYVQGHYLQAPMEEMNYDFSDES